MFVLSSRKRTKSASKQAIKQTQKGRRHKQETSEEYQEEEEEESNGGDDYYSPNESVADSEISSTSTQKK